MIVEDSRLARVELKKLLESLPQVQIVGESGDPDEALGMIRELRPQLLFLDIQMPGMNGFELLDALEQQPAVIFTTAYDQYAVRSFEYEAVDYLLKPIDSQRLAQAVARAEAHSDDDSGPLQPLTVDSSVFVKDGDNCWLVQLAEISHFESCGNYCKVFFRDQRPLIHRSLKQLEDRLPGELFFRASRQHIVNLKAVRDVEPWFGGALKLALANGEEIEVSRRHSSRFKTLLSL